MGKKNKGVKACSSFSIQHLPCPSGGPVLTQVGGLTVWLTTVTTPFPPTVTRGGGGGHAPPATADGLVAGTLVTIDGPPLLVSSSTERSGQVKILNNFCFTINSSIFFHDILYNFKDIIHCFSLTLSINLYLNNPFHL